MVSRRTRLGIWTAVLLTTTVAIGISDEWLKMMQGSEKQFSLGWFEPNYLRDCEIAVVQSNEGKITAFANVVPEYQLNEITIEWYQ